ncbi:MAG TPA: hypothetical protein VIN71_05290, partial [Pseudomonadales bacterium]
TQVRQSGKPKSRPSISTLCDCLAGNITQAPAGAFLFVAWRECDQAIVWQGGRWLIVVAGFAGRHAVYL